MKLKLVLISLVVLGSAGCVTSTNTYTRDIVYRDGSYYSPADEQYGDYYYEPEPEYSYYDDYSFYGFGPSYYGHHDGYRCRFSYHYDRYCDSGWGSFLLHFGGLTLVFGNAVHYGYGYGYPYYGYYDPYYYYGGYPYYSHHSPRPRPEHRGPIPMPKPVRPGNPIPDYSVNPNPGVRVPGEPIRMPTKPGLLETNPVEPVADDSGNGNPYTRSRLPRQPVRPEQWRNAEDNHSNDGILVREIRRPRPDLREADVPRMRTKPAPVIVVGNNDSNSAPIRQDHISQPGPIVNAMPREPRPAPAVRVQTRERVERAERPERSERVITAVRQTSKSESAEDD